MTSLPLASTPSSVSSMPNLLACLLFLAVALRLLFPVSLLFFGHGQGVCFILVGLAMPHVLSATPSAINSTPNFLVCYSLLFLFWFFFLLASPRDACGCCFRFLFFFGHCHGVCFGLVGLAMPHVLSATPSTVNSTLNFLVCYSLLFLFWFLFLLASPRDTYGCCFRSLSFF